MNIFHTETDIPKTDESILMRLGLLLMMEYSLFKSKSNTIKYIYLFFLKPFNKILNYDYCKLLVFQNT